MKKDKPQDPVTHPILATILIENINSNPNGDPSNNGEPRMDALDFNWISGVSIAKKIRLMIEHRDPVFLETAKNLGITPEEIKGNYNIYIRKDKTAQELAKEYKKNPSVFRPTYVDARWFGITLASKEDEDGKIGSPSCGGSIIISKAISLHPAQVLVADNTRGQGMTGTKTGNIMNGATKFVRYSLCQATIQVSPISSKLNQLTQRDVELFFALLPHIYSSFPSSTRCGTEIIQIWRFDKPLCCPLTLSKVAAITRPTSKLGKLEIPLSREDYVLKTENDIQAALSKIPNGKQIKLTGLDLA